LFSITLSSIKNINNGTRCATAWLVLKPTNLHPIDRFKKQNQVRKGSAKYQQALTSQRNGQPTGNFSQLSSSEVLSGVHSPLSILAQNASFIPTDLEKYGLSHQINFFPALRIMTSKAFTIQKESEV